MKTLLLFCCYLMGATLLFSDGRLNTEPSISLEGVWELENQQLFENGELTEMLENANEYRQVKMYSKGKVMWTRFDPDDSNEWFGYGSYTIKDGMLEERLEYASGPMMTIVDTTQVFRFELIADKNNYQQIQLDDTGEPIHGERYSRIE